MPPEPEGREVPLTLCKYMRTQAHKEEVTQPLAHAKNQCSGFDFPHAQESERPINQSRRQQIGHPAE